MSKFRCNGETECGKRCKLKRKFSEMENVYCKIHENQQNEICSICLNSTKSRIKIQCEHVFCKECIADTHMYFYAAPGAHSRMVRFA